MTTTRQLHSLQELDLALDSILGHEREAEQELNSKLALDQMEQDILEAKERLHELQIHQRLQRLEVEGLKERSTRLEERLYSGDATNPRELETLQQEAANVRRLVEQQDAELLELETEAEGCQANAEAMEKDLKERRSAWETRQQELSDQMNALASEREIIAAQKAKLTATLDPRELQKYEALRKSKGGRAVAKVERGLCQACRMSLPTQQLQRVRSGRQTVLCNSCGRMLFLG